MLRPITSLFLVSVTLFALGWSNPLGKARYVPSPSNPEINPDLFEGDIAGINPLDILNGKRPKDATTDPSILWPGGIMYYRIQTADFFQYELDIIQQAMDEYRARTCLDFVEWISATEHGAYYVLIQKTGGGCYSYIGRNIPRQPISLDTGCFGNRLPGTPIHEMMHAFGFYHEQSRTDRDDYVFINYDNIQAGYENNFLSYDETVLQTLGSEYDYGSVMHYPAYGFAIDPSIPTIIPLQDGVEIGQRVGFSNIDVFELNALYKCPPKK